MTRFGLKRRQLLLAIFLHLVLPLEIFGIEEFDKLCDRELEKEKIDRNLIIRYCTQAGENALKIENFEDASWFFLVSGNLDKNINKFRDYNNSLIIYTNVGHSYLLKNQLQKAKEYYTKVMQFQSDLDDAFQSDFKLLFKLYPHKKHILKEGLKIWNELYKPFISINKLYTEYEELEKNGEYDLAIKKLSQIISMKNRTIIKNHIAIMMDYYSLAQLYENRKINPKAIENYKKSLEISERFLDKNHIHIGTIYNDLAMVSNENRDFKEAEKYFYKGLSIYRTWFNEDDIEIGIFYNNLGTLYKDTREYSKAEEFYKKTILIENKHQSDEIVDTYDNLGLCYQKMKKYKMALNYHKKALEVRKNLGVVQTAIGYSVLGSYYQTVENYLEALNYHKRALKIREDKFGEFNIDTAETYHNLGATYEELRDYRRALEFYKKALEVNEKLLDKNDTDIAIVCNNISSIYNEEGNYTGAEKYISKALKIKERVFKPNDIELALTYNNRGLIFENMQKYNKALKDYNHSLEIYIDNLTENSKEVAIGYNNLASLYNVKQDYNSALKYLNKTKDILNRVSVNKEDTFMATLYNNLGLIYEYSGDYPNAYKNNSLSFKMFLKNRDQIFLTLDSKQKIGYLKSFGNRIDNLLNSAYFYIPISQEYTTIEQDIFNSWLKFKGTIFENSNILSAIETNPKTTSKIKKVIDNLKRLTIQLDDLDNNDLNYEKENFEEVKLDIEKQIHNIEVNLSKENIQFKEQLDLKKMNYEQIAINLKHNQLYIDFAKGEKNYYIFTLDSQENITFEQIDDNFTKDIDSNITKFLNINHKIAEDVNNIELIKTLQLKSTKILSNLQHKLITKNINRKDKNELIISPDGLLNFLPFEALFDGKKYLVEDYTISYISSGREFIRQIKRKKQTKLSKVIIFANPDFKLELAENSTKGTNITETLFDIDPLVKLDARKEIAVIKSHYREVIVYQEENATVDNLFQISPPKILHISTHGILLNNNNILNPMKRSVLAFSGADNAKYQGDARGFATALKLSSLNLEGTELVVLSACDTGLGEIHQAEGVIGLPKAFIQAGAKRVIMSLWSVSNNQTALLMGYFYDNISSEKNYAMALREAKLKMITLHPYFWSAFIINGI